MIRVPDCSLLPPTQAELDAWQAEVDQHAQPFGDHVAAAEREFDRRRAQRGFEPALALLRAMCSGVVRCMYCQDSGGVDVEHFQPKSWYPDLVFAWANFLLVCTRCNRKKSNRFPVFHPRPNTVRELVFKKGAARRRPPVADAVLLNPRLDDPQAYLALDLLGTFRFVPSATPGSVPHLRAAHTLEKLDLNDDDLTRARRNAYDNFLSHLCTAGRACAAGDGAELVRVRDAIAATPGAVVWREMQRMHAVIPTLGRAFAAVPGALHW